MLKLYYILRTPMILPPIYRLSWDKKLFQLSLYFFHVFLQAISEFLLDTAFRVKQIFFYVTFDACMKRVVLHTQYHLFFLRTIESIISIVRNIELTWEKRNNESTFYAWTIVLIKRNMNPILRSYSKKTTIVILIMCRYRIFTNSV